jgi:hypothetical protein
MLRNSDKYETLKTHGGYHKIRLKTYEKWIETATTASGKVGARDLWRTAAGERPRRTPAIGHQKRSSQIVLALRLASERPPGRKETRAY